MSMVDYNPGTGMWFSQDLPKDVADSVAMDWSKPAKVYCTKNRYAALALWDYLTPRAREPVFLDQLEVEASWAKDFLGLRNFTVPPEENLYDFQKCGISYALNRDSCLIADQPGLGKTAQAIVTANELKAERVLVVCPASVRLQWREMFFRWQWPRTQKTRTGTPVCDVVLSSHNGIYSGAAPHWIIISYDLVVRSPRLYNRLMEQQWDMLILDEVHYLKSFDARRTRAIFGAGSDDQGIAANASYKVGLTGTPLPNRPRECYAVARTFDWDSIDKLPERRFRDRYNPSMSLPNGHNLEAVARLPELQVRLRSTFMVRRLKREVLTQLPQVQYELTYVEPSKEVSRVLKAESLLNIDPLNFDKSDMEIVGHIATVRQQMGVAKAPLVVDHVQRLLDGGVDKLVVFTWHREVLSILTEKLAEFQPVIVQGGTTAPQKHEAKKRFMNDPNCRLFMGNILACGTGTDGLQEVASMSVFAEASWVPGENDQAVDRLWRMGQQGTVLAQFLVAPGSLDERVLGSAIAKAHNTHETLDKRIEA